MTPAQPYRILLVDDHEMMRMGLKALALLEATVPIQWLEASNLLDAMTMYEKDGEIDLVLLDMNLPDSQGLQSLQRFMARCPKAKVALFSGTEDSFVIKQALQLGAVGFVPKSAQASATLGTIEVLLSGQQGLQTLCRWRLNPRHWATSMLPNSRYGGGDLAGFGAVARAGLAMANGFVKGVTKPSAKPS